MSNELDGMIYDPIMRTYVPEFPETEDESRFIITEPLCKIDVSDLPPSPKGFYRTASEAGWEIRAWMTLGSVPPTLYLHDSEQDDGENAVEPHFAGDVKFDGYRALLYVVEARASLFLPLGFRAHFEGREYEEDQMRNKAGGFDHAWIADPVGIAQELHYDYQPIKVIPGKDSAGRVVETNASIAANKKRAQIMADYLNQTANDGSFILKQRAMISSSTALTTWLKEWASYGRLLNV